MVTHWKKSYDHPRQHIKKQRYYFANKDLSSQGYGFSCGHVWMWELDYKERWALKNWCFWTIVLEKTLESPFDCKEIQPVHPKGNQSWMFIGRTDAEAKAPILWPPDAKSWLIWKDPDAGKDWRQEKGTTEDEMVGWHHQLNGREFVQTPGKPGVLQFMVSQRVGHNWVTELNWMLNFAIWYWNTFINKCGYAIHDNYNRKLVHQFTQSCLTLCDPMNCSMPGLPVHHQLPESTQTHVPWVGDVIQPSHLKLCYMK